MTKHTQTSKPTQRPYRAIYDAVILALITALILALIATLCRDEPMPDYFENQTHYVCMNRVAGGEKVLSRIGKVRPRCLIQLKN